MVVAYVSNGIDGTVVLRLVVALVATAIGILLGRAVDERSGRREAAA
jgi:hypothetical protein